MVDTGKTLTAIEELKRWEKREEEILERMKELKEEKKKLQEKAKDLKNAINECEEGIRQMRKSGEPIKKHVDSLDII